MRDKHNLTLLHGNLQAGEDVGVLHFYVGVGHQFESAPVSRAELGSLCCICDNLDCFLNVDGRFPIYCCPLGIAWRAHLYLACIQLQLQVERQPLLGRRVRGALAGDQEWQ